MDWISVKDKLPNRESSDMYWVTDGETIGWSFFGCNDEGLEHDRFIGGDMHDTLSENITHWCEVKLPTGEKIKRKNRLEF